MGIQKIIHIDMDCFFAAVEMRDFPELRDKAMAVGGAADKRGVISTCNYEARKYGVRSAMPTAQAMKLCPHLVLVPGRMSVYKEVSTQIRQIFSRYTDIIEPLSLDEAYLDVTDSPHCYGSATYIAQAICQQIEAELCLTASAGVAPIKFLAKIASDMNKPNGITVIPPEKVEKTIEQLDLNKIPGVGKVSYEKLTQAGYSTCLDIKQANYRELLSQFGRLGDLLWQRSHGKDPRRVEPIRERKSVGVERTFETNLKSFEQCQAMIENKLYPELKQRLEKHDPDGQIVKQGVKLKFADFQQTTIEHGYTEINLEGFITLLEEIWLRQQGREVRLAGIHVMLKPNYLKQQLSLI
ncbi:MAG: DNA polymerase IV [Vibrio sp.]